MTKFDKERTGTGTKEWAEVNENIAIGCPNGCLYCYAATNAADPRFGAYKPRADWHNEVLSKRAEITSYPARQGVIMFPSTHDITPFNVATYIRVALLMLEKGNQLLITTKARPDIMEALCKAFDGFQKQILFRITIGSMEEPVVAFWEPGAPAPWERIRAMGIAQSRNFQTSVSIEPMLGGLVSTLAVVGAVKPFVTETIWIGKMNKINLRVECKDHDTRLWCDALVRLQSDQQIVQLYRALQQDPQIRWKDSIKEVLVNYNLIPAGDKA